MNSTPITATLEDYLEAILNIVSRHKVARSMEIAESLNVKRPTVTVALKALAEKGLINYEPRSYITLTEDGEKIATCVDKRHHILRDLFQDVLRLPYEESEKAACLMEHGMDNSVCKAIISLLHVMKKDVTLSNALIEAMEHERKSINCDSECDYGLKHTTTESSTKNINDLNLLQSGQSGKIIRMLGTGTLRKRLGEMGITTGQIITVVKAAPLDDPIEVKVRNYNLSLRREEAANILVEME